MCHHGLKRYSVLYYHDQVNAIHSLATEHPMITFPFLYNFFLFSLELMIALFSCLRSFSMYLSIIQPCFTTCLNCFFLVSGIHCFIALCRYCVLWQIGGLWPPFILQICWHHFSSGVRSRHVSVARFGNSHSISHLFLIIFVMVICDL